MIDLFFSACHSLFHLNHSSCYLSESRFRKSDNCNVMNLRVRYQEVLNLYRINIFTARYYYVFLSVNKPNKSVLVHHGHVAREKPAVPQCLMSRSRIVVVTEHDSRTFHAEFARLALRNVPAFVVDYLQLPAVTGYTDRPDLVNVLHSQVNTARPCRL